MLEQELASIASSQYSGTDLQLTTRQWWLEQVGHIQASSSIQAPPAAAGAHQRVHLVDPAQAEPHLGRCSCFEVVKQSGPVSLTLHTHLYVLQI